MKYRPLPIGVDDFEEIITKEYYYVDKTLMIKELLDKKGKVNLFTRPRRFGKTLNLSMLQYYFEAHEGEEEKRGRAELFSGLAIAKAGEAYVRGLTSMTSRLRASISRGTMTRWQRSSVRCLSWRSKRTHSLNLR